MMESNKYLYQYNHYHSFMEDIDNGNVSRLLNQNLEDFINEKQKGITPLFLACLKRLPRLVKYLISQGADPNIICRERTALWQAIYMFEFEIVIDLLHAGADPNLMYRGLSPLHVSAIKGFVEFCDILIQYGADVNINTPKFGTPWMIAASKGHNVIFKCLFKHNLDYSLTNDEGETVLHIAARKGNYEVIRLLTQNDIDIDPHKKENTEQATALHHATKQSYDKIVKLIISKWPETIWDRNAFGLTPLFYLKRRMKISIIDSFLAKIKKSPFKYSKQYYNYDTIIKAPVVVGEEEYNTIHCHAAIIWARCPSLHEKLKLYDYDTKDREEQIITINNFNYSVVKAFVLYLYDDKVECSKTDLKHLQQMAVAYNMDRLANLVASQMGKQISIPNSTLLQDIGKLYNNPLFSDIVIISESQKIYAHRFILSIFSHYFVAIFENDVIEKLNRSVELKETSFKTVSTVIKWMYTCKLTGTNLSTILDILKVSNRLMISTLNLSCQFYITNKLYDYNIVQLLELSDMLDAQLIKEECYLALLSDEDLLKSVKQKNPSLLEEFNRVIKQT